MSLPLPLLFSPPAFLLPLPFLLPVPLPQETLINTPSPSFRSFYPTYATIYQTGVFISRSSLPLLRIHNLYLPSLLQILNLLLLIAQALFDFIPSVWIVFAVVFWEGLLGGAVYVNTFAEVGERYVILSFLLVSLLLTCSPRLVRICYGQYVSRFSGLEIGLS